MTSKLPSLPHFFHFSWFFLSKVSKCFDLEFQLDLLYQLDITLRSSLFHTIYLHQIFFNEPALFIFVSFYTVLSIGLFIAMFQSFFGYDLTKFAKDLGLKTNRCAQLYIEQHVTPEPPASAKTTSVGGSIPVVLQICLHGLK